MLYHGIFTDRAGSQWISREVKTAQEWLPRAGNVPARGERRENGSRHNPWSNKSLTLTGLRSVSLAPHR